MLTPSRHRPPFDSPRWTEADAQAVLAELARSGLSVREFAERYGLDPQRLYVWRRRVASGDRSMFREVLVRATPAAARTETQGSMFELTLRSGVKVGVAASFDAESLTRLLEVLGRTSTC